jgi:hypothetical protein
MRSFAVFLGRAAVGAVLLGAVLCGLATWRFGSPRVALACARGDRVVVEPSLLNLGECGAGESRRLTYRIHNLSARPLGVMGGTTTCTCVATSGLPLVIEPWGTEQLIVDVSLRSRGEDFRHTVTWFMDCPTEPRVDSRIVATLQFEKSSNKTP